MSPTTESKAFAERLQAALESSGIRRSPSVVAHEFNLRYWGRSVTPHTARNWLMGNSMPTQDKLRVLAEWLQVSPDELRFGNRSIASKDKVSQSLSEPLKLADQEMLTRYLALSITERKIVRDVVEALAVAARLKNTK